MYNKQTSHPTGRQIFSRAQNVTTQNVARWAEETEGYFLPVWLQQMLSFTPNQQTSSQSCLGISACSVGLPTKLILYCRAQDPSLALCLALCSSWFAQPPSSWRSADAHSPAETWTSDSHFVLLADVWVPGRPSVLWLSYPLIPACLAIQSWPNACSQLWAPDLAGLPSGSPISSALSSASSRTCSFPTLCLGKDYSASCENWGGGRKRVREGAKQESHPQPNW